MKERCDQIVHCRDKSDENQCALLVFEESYKKKVPPIDINTVNNSIIPVIVSISTSLLNVLEISEFTHTIDLKLSISLEWYENRVQYHNLKIEEALNVLSDSEVSQICNGQAQVRSLKSQSQGQRTCADTKITWATTPP